MTRIVIGQHVTDRKTGPLIWFAIGHGTPKAVSLPDHSGLLDRAKHLSKERLIHLRIDQDESLQWLWRDKLLAPEDTLHRLDGNTR